MGTDISGWIEAKIPSKWQPIQSLMGTDLIDEYRFLVLPYIMGRGRRFFPDGTPPTKLRLVESKMLTFGTLALIYQPDKK
jgi:dihydrofolate reductase